jgi:hypothetical protein
LPRRRSWRVVFSLIVGLVSPDSVFWLLKDFLSFELVIIVVVISLFLIFDPVRNGDRRRLVSLVAVLPIDVLLLYLHWGHILRSGAFRDNASPVLIALRSCTCFSTLFCSVVLH